MKRLFLLFLCLLPATLFALAVGETIPSLQLTDKVLTNVTIIAVRPTYIMAKWDGGRGTIHRGDIPSFPPEAVAKIARPGVAAASSPLNEKDFARINAKRKAEGYIFPVEAQKRDPVTGRYVEKSLHSTLKELDGADNKYTDAKSVSVIDNLDKIRSMQGFNAYTSHLSLAELRERDGKDKYRRELRESLKYLTAQNAAMMLVKYCEY